MSALPHVTLYTQPGCSPCVALKSRLRGLAIPFAEVDVTADPEALARVREAGFTTTPVVEIRGSRSLDGLHRGDPPLVRRLAAEATA